MRNSIKGLSRLVRAWKQDRVIASHVVNQDVLHSATDGVGTAIGGNIASSSFSSLSYNRHSPSKDPVMRLQYAEDFVSDGFTRRDMIEYNINYAIEVLQEYFPEVNMMHINIPNVEGGSRGLLLEALEKRREDLKGEKPTYIYTTVRGIDVGHYDGDYTDRKLAHHAVLMACNNFADPDAIRFFYDVNGADGYGGSYREVMSGLKNDLAAFSVDGAAGFSGKKVIEKEERSTIAKGVCAQATFETLVASLEEGMVESLVASKSLDSAKDQETYDAIEGEFERSMFAREVIAVKIRQMNGLKKYMVAYHKKMREDGGLESKSSVDFIFPTNVSKLREKGSEHEMV